MKRVGILLLVFCTCFAFAAWPQTQPTIIVIDPLGAGNANNVMRGFVRSSDGKVKTFDAPGAGNLSVPGFVGTPTTDDTQR